MKNEKYIKTIGVLILMIPLGFIIKEIILATKFENEKAANEKRQKIASERLEKAKNKFDQFYEQKNSLLKSLGQNNKFGRINLDAELGPFPEFLPNLTISGFLHSSEAETELLSIVGDHLKNFKYTLNDRHKLIPSSPIPSKSYVSLTGGSGCEAYYPYSIEISQLNENISLTISSKSTNFSPQSKQVPINEFKEFWNELMFINYRRLNGIGVGQRLSTADGDFTLKIEYTLNEIEHKEMISFRSSYYPGNGLNGLIDFLIIDP